MADYAVVGRKGTGKSLTCIGLIRDALISNKRVATNLNVHLDHLMHPTSKKTVLRLPDHPTVHDFEAIGRGQDGVVEEDNGIIVLDETSHFFNARDWGDKSRGATLKWLTESRKIGWDVYYIAQGIKQLDSQIRETQLEYVVHIKRTDKWPIPFVTFITGLLFGQENAIRFPKMRIATTKQGIERDALTVGHRFYKAASLFNAYDTQQRFFPSQPPNEWNTLWNDGGGISPGLHTQLSAYHLKGRYLPKAKSLSEHFSFLLSVLVWLAYKVTGTTYPKARTRGARSAPRPVFG